MTVQVLGSGCPTCKKLFDITQQAVAAMESDITVEYITGPEGTQKIIALGAMSSPVLAVNDQIAMVGFTPDIQRIQDTIKQFL